MFRARAGSITGRAGWATLRAGARPTVIRRPSKVRAGLAGQIDFWLISKLDWQAIAGLGCAGGVSRWVAVEPCRFSWEVLG